MKWSIHYGAYAHPKSSTNIRIIRNKGLILLMGCSYWYRVTPITAYSSSLPTYDEARATRIVQGHAAAVPLYQQLLVHNPQDRTAASRIAASEWTMSQQDKACQADCEDIKKWKHILDTSNYNNKYVQQLFGIRGEGSLGYDSQGPLFLRPVSAGSTLTPPILQYDRQGKTMGDMSLVCLASLFLLGFAGKVLLGLIF